MKSIYRTLIEPAEAIQLSRLESMEYYCKAKAIQSYYRESGERHNDIFELLLIYNAGRIQGIREERQKKRASAEVR